MNFSASGLVLLASLFALTPSAKAEENPSLGLRLQNAAMAQAFAVAKEAKNVGVLVDELGKHAHRPEDQRFWRQFLKAHKISRLEAVGLREVARNRGAFELRFQSEAKPVFLSLLSGGAPTAVQVRSQKVSFSASDSDASVFAKLEKALSSAPEKATWMDTLFPPAFAATDSEGSVVTALVSLFGIDGMRTLAGDSASSTKRFFDNANFLCREELSSAAEGYEVSVTKRTLANLRAEGLDEKILASPRGCEGLLSAAKKLGMETEGEEKSACSAAATFFDCQKKYQARDAVPPSTAPGGSSTME